MIIYNSFCGGFNLLLSRHAWWGSPISKGFPFGLFSMLIAVLIRCEFIVKVFVKSTRNFRMRNVAVTSQKQSCCDSFPSKPFVLGGTCPRSKLTIWSRERLSWCTLILTRYCQINDDFNLEVAKCKVENEIIILSRTQRLRLLDKNITRKIYFTKFWCVRASGHSSSRTWSGSSSSSAPSRATSASGRSARKHYLEIFSENKMHRLKTKRRRKRKRQTRAMS